ncbi:MAG: 6-pyruvoyl-tetrahydropterin synthase-related protein [Sulfuritalea sp.]|jgi:hypothetical protein|nr:6-pyruvoyl-tetrahydropterin synthase-related protein [Sulfuritalea sp.]
MLKHLANWPGDVAVAFVTAVMLASVLGIDLLNSPNWPTGGDSASHLLYAWLYADELLFSGHILPWVPEVFGGLPFLSYYFPLPFIVIALLSKLIGFAPAFKWGAFLASLLLPGAVYASARRWLGFGGLPALFGALGALAFLLHEQNSIWGGNLLSTLAGEFAYSYGLVFAVLALTAWARVARSGRGWILAAVLEAACGFSHGFPLLVVGFSTILLLFDCSGWQSFRTLFGLLARGHLLAFALLGGWLWPMLEMHGLTIPNDASFPLNSWRDLLPTALWPVLGAGSLGLCALLLPGVRACWTPQQAIALRYFIGAAGLAALGFIVGDRIGLADIRFFPLVWLLAAVASGWLFGQMLASFDVPADEKGVNRPWLVRMLLVAASCLGLAGWLGEHIHEAPGWSLWNHAGLDARPQWRNLSTLFPVLQGNLWSPRLLFEHDPANNDIGSTRTLEALPMFLGHRPVLEGLYMESALLGPAVYQLQSEVSARPSSPLVRFPGGSLDPQFAAAHMNFLHADTLLLRSDEARKAFAASGLFEQIAAAPPFTVFRLRQFDSRLAQVVSQKLSPQSRQDWMEHAFAWFRTRSRFNGELPIFIPASAPAIRTTATPLDAVVRPISLTRHELVFETMAPGTAHLIKLAYHPRWQLVTKGRLEIAGPGFMLVVPEESRIRLVYGHTLAGRLGIAATLSATLFLAIVLWRRRAGAAVTPTPTLGVEAVGLRHRWPQLLGWLALAASGAFFALHSPEQAYNEAWMLMRANRYEAAGDRFLVAYELRRPLAKKEEALFWLAKSRELAGRRTEAKAHYRELCENYHGYWLPESLYTLAMLEQQEQVNAERYRRRLRQEFPANPWTIKLTPK